MNESDKVLFVFQMKVRTRHFEISNLIRTLYIIIDDEENTDDIGFLNNDQLAVSSSIIYTNDTKLSSVSCLINKNDPDTKFSFTFTKSVTSEYKCMLQISYCWA